MARQLILFAIAAVASTAEGYRSGYPVEPGQRSAMFAMGCFWCAEQAYEQFAPGVVEAVSGYAGGDVESPTYQGSPGHYGHYEVVLVVYDVTLTSYETLVAFFWRNVDLLDGGGQFCDRGTAYKPALFFDGEEERLVAEGSLAALQAEHPDWDVRVELLERPVFWESQPNEGHQDFYITNSGTYYFYKNRCGRTERLKEVWGNDEYECYHELEPTCEAVLGMLRNAHGTAVDAAVVNRKGVEEGKASIVPSTWVPWLVIGGVAFAAASVAWIYTYQVKRQQSKTKAKSSSNAVAVS